MIRIRKNARVTSRGHTRSAGRWLASLTPGTLQHRRKRVGIYGPEEPRPRLEVTRLREDERLVALLALAFTYRVGAWLAQRRPTRVKGHGRTQRSAFRVGLDDLREVLLNSGYRSVEFPRCLRPFQVT